MNDLVSAIITTYKRKPSMVVRAIRSVLSQTYQRIELIIVDDSPGTYADRDAVKKAVYKEKEENPRIPVRYIQHSSNMGACAARNTGLYAAKGKYIAYLDDDDEWLPTKIEKQIKALENSHVGLVYCGCICMNDNTGRMVERKTVYCRGRVFDKLLYRNFIDSTSFPLLKKECLEAVGGFDLLMESAQDYDVWLRIAQKYEIDYVPEPLVIYHEHEGEQITNNPRKKISGLERINKKFAIYIESNPALWRQRNIVITPYYSLIGNKEKALKTWGKCVLKNPGRIINNIKYLITIIVHSKI